MIQVTIAYCCRVCGNTDIVKNGSNPQYHCKTCKAYRVLEPRRRHEEDEKAMVMRVYKERASMRGLERIFDVARQTVARWIRDIVQALPDLKDTLLPAKPDDVLELDELCPFVLKKSRKRWLWTAICRRTRQVVAFAIGDRSTQTCRRLWVRIPDAYKRCQSFSDFWEAYQKVFPKETHRCVGKESGETAHMERWYNILRQRLARFIRKTLSFSKSDTFHHMVTKWYIAEYNLALSLTL